METRGRHTTAAVMFWTPAPACTSPSSVGSEVDWDEEEDEEEEGGRKEEEEEDFHSQMDENGIIGLDEASEDVGLQEDEEEEDVGLQEEEEEGGGSPPWNSGGQRPGEGFPGGLGGVGLEPGDPGEEPTCDLSDLQDSEPRTQSQLAGEDFLSLYEDVAGGPDTVDVWTEDEELRQKDEEEQKWLIHQLSMERLPERDRQLDMTEEEEEEDGEIHGYAGMSSSPVRPEAGSRWTEDQDVQEEDGEEAMAISGHGAQPLSTEAGEHSDGECFGREEAEHAGSASGRHSPASPVVRPTPRGPSPTAGSLLPHLLHFSSEELAHAPGIEAETFPETALTESPPESRSSRLSHAPRSHWLPESDGEELKPRVALPYPAATSTESGIPGLRGGAVPTKGSGAVSHGRRPDPSPRRKARQRSPETTPSKAGSPQKAWSESSWKNSVQDCQARTPRESPSKPVHRTQDTEGDQGRRGVPSYRTPDFSKVGPRVRFPKHGYSPPKSKSSPRKSSLSAEPPLVFKSPADIVREVLLTSADGPSSTSPPCGSHRSPKATVPEDFRCPQQATTLVQQLQEDYNRLLTKFAEAENTIDRLRLEAKVSLYSDPPKPSHSVQSGVLHEGSKFMTLTFPQAQRAEFSSGSVHLDGQGSHSGGSPARPSSAASTTPRSLGPRVGQQLTKTLAKQADRFLQQVQAFEDLLRRGKLKPYEQIKGLSQLLQGLDCLESGYLAARDEHRLLQHRGTEPGPFDHDRELEGLIFQCGVRVEELKEHMEQTEQPPPTSEAPPSPPPGPAPLSIPASGRETMPLPERPVVPVPGASGGAVEVEVSSASGESEGEEGETEDEDALPSLLLRPLRQKHQRVERDFSALMDHYQSFRELPGLLDPGLVEGRGGPAAAGEEGPPGEDGPGGEPHRGQGSEENQETLLQSQSMAVQQRSQTTPPARPTSSKSDRSSPKAGSKSPAFPGQSSNGGKRSAVGRSHSSSLTSLGESAASDRRYSKRQLGGRRAPSQDGIISPETDSGFVGSESSRLTPAAPSPLHQRAPLSVSSPQEESPGKAHNGPVSGQPLPPSPLQRPPPPEHSGGSRPSTPGQLRTLPRRNQGGERRETSVSSSPQNWAGSGSSECGPDSDQIHSISGEDEGQSDHYAQPTNPHPRYPPSPSPAAPYHHGDPLPAPSRGQLTRRNEAIQSLQTEVTRLRERLEGSLRLAEPPRHVTAPPAARGGYSHPHASTPRIRSAQRLKDGGREGRRGEEEGEEVQRTPRPSPQRRSASVPQQRLELDITTDSEHAQSTPRPRSSRRIPGCTAAQEGRRGHADAIRTRGGCIRRSPGVSAGLPGADDQPDSGRCPRCAPRHHSTPARPEESHGDPRDPGPPPPPRCALCGRSEAHRSAGTERDRRRERDTGHSPRGSRPMSSPHVFLAAPPPLALGSVPLVQCVPVCPPQALYYASPVLKTPSYPQPFCVFQGMAVASGVRGRAEVRGGAGRSLSADHCSISSSLNQAIQAARGMREASRRMAQSVATGLHHQGALSQSCMY